MSNTNCEKISYKTILKEKNFMLYLSGQLISRLGDSIDMIAYGWMVYEVTGQTSLMALLFGVNAIPTILFQPFAGVLVGYKKKKHTLLICNLGRAIIVTITAILFLQGYLKTYHLFIFTFINSTFEAFQSPASMAALPLILEKDKYTYGMSLRSTLSNTVELFGLAIAATIISLIGLSGAMLINAASFYICGFLMWIAKYKYEVIQKQPLNFSSYFSDFKEGFVFMRKNNIILSICVFGAIFNFLMIPLNTLSIAFVNEELGLGPAAISIINISSVLGMILGSFIFPKVNEKLKGITIFIISGLSIGFTYILLPFTALMKIELLIYPILCILTFSFGIFISLLSSLISISFMKKTPQEFLPRVGGVFNSLVQSANPVGSLIVSSLCVFLNTATLYIVFGAFTILLFIAQKFNKSLVEL